MASNVFEKILGTINSYFQIGIDATAVRLKNNAGALETKNKADTAFVPVRTSQLEITDGAGTVLTLDAVDALGTATTIKFPAKGTDGQFFRQKAGTAVGVIEFELATIAGASDKQSVDTTTIAFGATSPVTLFQLPANAKVESVEVIVDTPFNGAPQLSIGITGTTSKYMAANENDLTAAAGTSFEVYPTDIPSGSVENLIATYSAGGANAGSGRVVIEFAIPT